MPELLFGQDLETLDSIEVDVNGRDEEKEEVLLDFEHGPVLNRPDGSFEYYDWCPNAYASHAPMYPGSGKPQIKKSWRDMSSTEKQVATIMVAKRNRALRNRTGIGNPSKEKLAEGAPSKPGTSWKPQEPAAAAAPAAGSPQSTSFSNLPPPMALLFPGQGSQYVGMLQGLEDKAEVTGMLAKANDILGYDLRALCLDGPEEKLAETRYCQPAMFVGGLAAAAKLRAERGEVALNPRCVAGLSLGEYTALCIAGVFSFEDGLRLVKLRGEAMQSAASIGKQAMLSVVGLERDVVVDLCRKATLGMGAEAVCEIANDLFPKGFSCAGHEKCITRLQDLADKKNALQVKMLKASGGFHTELMEPAKERLQAALEEILPRMKPPTCTVYMNVTGEPIEPGCDPQIIVHLLTEQLVNPVLWSPSVERMIVDGITEFYECGPQKQIKAMMKRISTDAWAKTVNVQV